MIDNEALQSIEKLHEMKASGIISDEEFTQAKQRLLQGGKRPAAPKAAAILTAEPTGRPADNDHFGWMILPLRRYAQFEGRSSRKEFWLFMLLTNAAAFALTIIFFADTTYYYQGDMGLYNGDTGLIGNLALVVLTLGVLGMLVPFIAVQVRRFHDQGRSGWFALLNLIPYLGVLIVLGFMLVPSVDGDNQYGPDPQL